MDIFCDDEEYVDFVWRLLGYTLTGDTSESMVFILHGDGANGKSVLLKVIRSLLGGYAQVTGFNTFDKDNSSKQGFDLAALRGARFVAVSESNEGRHFDEARIKTASGDGDDIPCEQKYGQPFSYPPMFKAWLAVNHLPRVKGTEHAMKRRLVVMPFSRTFEGDQQDRRLSQRLLAEGNGILTRALKGCLDWQRDGKLLLPAAVTRASEQYWDEMDTTAQWFEECCEKDPGEATTTHDLHQSYSDWKLSRGEKPTGAIELGRWLKRNHPDLQQGKVRGSRGWKGVKVQPPDFRLGRAITFVGDSPKERSN